jgi:hypothetical protein
MRPDTARNERFARWAFWCVLTCLLIQRGWLLLAFGTVWTGSDDVLFWNVATDMANGEFHEPFIYGQNYNPAVEPLLAVPLLWSGVPHHIALPLVTALLAIAPFVSFGLWNLRRKAFGAAIGFVAVPLLLPVEYGLMTSTTRGFVTGLAVLALLPLAMGLRSARWRAMLTAFILGLALWVNPNTLLIAVPFFLHFWLSQERRWPALGWSGLGALPVAIIQVLAQRFYTVHPERIVHRMDDWRMDFHGELIPEAFGQLDRHFAWLCPVWWPNGQVVLWAILGIAVVLALRKRWIPALAVGSVLPLIVIAFGFPKVHDGWEHITFPYSRMFLAMPLLLAWALPLLPSLDRLRRPATLAILVIAPVASINGIRLTQGKIDGQMAHQEGLPVIEVPVHVLNGQLAALEDIAQRTQAEAVVCLSAPDARMAILWTYAAATRPDLPPTLFIGPDRRAWRRSEEESRVQATVVLIGGRAEFWQRMKGQGLDIEPLYLIGGHAHVLRGNTRPLLPLLRELKMTE